MKILVVCQHYWPEPYPLPDICEELVRRGHTVDLITDVPNYPMGITYPEYKGGARRKAGTAFFRRRRECLSYIRPIACGSAVDTAGIKVTSSRPPMMAT